MSQPPVCPATAFDYLDNIEIPRVPDITINSKDLQNLFPLQTLVKADAIGGVCKTTVLKYGKKQQVPAPYIEFGDYINLRKIATSVIPYQIDDETPNKTVRYLFTNVNSAEEIRSAYAAASQIEPEEVQLPTSPIKVVRDIRLLEHTSIGTHFTIIRSPTGSYPSDTHRTRFVPCVVDNEYIDEKLFLSLQLARFKRTYTDKTIYDALINTEDTIEEGEVYKGKANTVLEFVYKYILILKNKIATTAGGNINDQTIKYDAKLPLHGGKSRKRRTVKKPNGGRTSKHIGGLSPFTLKPKLQPTIDKLLQHITKTIDIPQDLKIAPPEEEEEFCGYAKLYTIQPFSEDKTDAINDVIEQRADIKSIYVIPDDVWNRCYVFICYHHVAKGGAGRKPKASVKKDVRKRK